MHVPATPVPVTLVTGFLGAGKTTFLNHLLSADHGAKLGVIINEFDEIGVDRDLVVNTNGQLVEMNNGCLCCSVEGDLKDVIASMLEAGPDLEGLVIETTGLANPGPIAAAFFADPYLCDATRMDAIVTMVDAFHIRRHLEATEHPNEEAGVVLAQLCYADVLLLNKTDLVPEEELARLESELSQLNALAVRHRTRYGLVPLDEVLHLRAFEFETRNRALAEAQDSDHHHDSEIGSVSFRFTGAFDQVKLNTFLCNLLRDHGATLYRCKGVLNIKGLDEPLLFQGVSSLFATSSGQAWKEGEPRVSKAVFIGKNLERGPLEQGLRACLTHS